MEKQQGKIVRWFDQKGFGFIKPNHGKDDIFIHITQSKYMSRKPVVGDLISFEIGLDNQGKKRAINASIEGVDTILKLEPTRRKYKQNSALSKRHSDFESTKPSRNRRSKSKFSLAMIRWMVIAIVVVGAFSFYNNPNVLKPSPFRTLEQTAVTNTDSLFAEAYKKKTSNLQMSGRGRVEKSYRMILKKAGIRNLFFDWSQDKLY